MAYLGSGKRYYLILTGIFVLVTMAVSLIFSQRALLFALGFEIIYVTHLYRGLNMRKLLIAAVPFAFVLLAIGAVRAMGTEGGGLGEGALVAIDKLMSSRYFLHIAKVGSVYEWQRVVGEVDLLAFNFLVEPFAPDDTVYFKDIGRIVGMEVFGTPTSGVTLGMVSEYILSFGAAIGSIFVFATLFVVFLAEKTMLQSVRPSLIMFFALAKVPILLNTSLGSFLYQTALETFMLLLVIPGLAFATPRPAGRGSRRVTRKVVNQYGLAAGRPLEIEALKSDVLRLGDVEIGEQPPTLRHVPTVVDRPQAGERNIAAELKVADHGAPSSAQQLLPRNELPLRKPGKPHAIPLDQIDKRLGPAVTAPHFHALGQETGVIDRSDHSASADLQAMPIGPGNRDVTQDAVARTAHHDDAILAAVPGNDIGEGEALDVLQRQLVRGGRVVATIGTARPDDLQSIDGQAAERLPANRRRKENRIDLA
jgi:hypothetical protein